MTNVPADLDTSKFENYPQFYPWNLNTDDTLHAGKNIKQFGPRKAMNVVSKKTKVGKTRHINVKKIQTLKYSHQGTAKSSYQGTGKSSYAETDKSSHQGTGKSSHQGTGKSSYVETGKSSHVETDKSSHQMSDFRIKSISVERPSSLNIASVACKAIDSEDKTFVKELKEEMIVCHTKTVESKSEFLVTPEDNTQQKAYTPCVQDSSNLCPFDQQDDLKLTQWKLMKEQTMIVMLPSQTEAEHVAACATKVDQPNS